MATNDHVQHSQAPVAYITGGASGIGLAVTEKLVKQGWNVTIVDVVSETGQKVADRLGEQVLFVKADVTDYDQQAKAFVETWAKWHRLDFVFANAGFDDRMNFYAPAKERDDGAPTKPNILVLEACLNGVVFAAYLALHYFRKNDGKAGKFVATSSMCGLYAGGGVPLYTAAKHGVVGLTRAISRRLTELKEPITVNCLCPGIVETGLTGGVMDIIPPKNVTPQSTILKAIDIFMNDNTITGVAAECSGENIYYREQPDFGDEGAAWVMGPELGELYKQKYGGSSEDRPR